MREKNPGEKNQERKEEKKKEFVKPEPKSYVKIIRILSTDIPGDKPVFIGLSRIKGVGYSMANAACIKLEIPREKKVEQLDPEEIKKISEFLLNPKLPEFLLNRRKDIETGENMHLIGSDLSLQNEFDVKRMKKIKSYKGIRHIQGQPVRGQRTRSHFRKNKSLGVSKSKK